MKKLLHERLREIADEKEGELYSRDIIEALCKEFGVCENKSSYGVDLCNCLKAIADEIEKYYIPRPRFEDGEPVQFGEEFADCSGNPHTLHEVRYRDKAAAGLGAKCLLEATTNSSKDYDGISLNLWDGNFVKRPESKVLDADGVPCKKGETVWNLDDSTKWEIVDIHQTEPCISVHQLDIDKYVSGGWFLASGFTHREPDSLEKLQQFAVDSAAYAEGCEKDKFLEIADRLTAIMERDA